MSAIERWARHMGLPAPQQADHLALTIDKARVHLRHIQSGQLMVEGRVCDLPETASVRSRLVERALQLSLARSRASLCHPAVDENQSALWLQQRIDAPDDLHALDQAVEDLVNEIELWRQAL